MRQDGIIPPSLDVPLLELGTSGLIQTFFAELTVLGITTVGSLRCMTKKDVQYFAQHTGIVEPTNDHAKEFTDQVYAWLHTHGIRARENEHSDHERTLKVRIYMFFQKRGIKRLLDLSHTVKGRVHVYLFCPINILPGQLITVAKRHNLQARISRHAPLNNIRFSIYVFDKRTRKHILLGSNNGQDA